MVFDFSRLPVQASAFAVQPMRFLGQERKAALSTVMEMALLETSSPEARERWQQAQLRNLLHHAANRSPFWRKRLRGQSVLKAPLQFLPILTRSDLKAQVSSEGPLLPTTGGMQVYEHATSGSSGVPVKFYVSTFNSRYNELRSATQYFLEGRDLSLNRTRMLQSKIKNRINPDAESTRKITYRTDSFYLGDLSTVFRSGQNIHIEYHDPDIPQLVASLRQNPIGCLVSATRIIDSLLSVCEPSILKDLGTQMWVPLGEGVSSHLRQVFGNLQIPIRATYSSEEVGLIGSECARQAGHYHIASSNVIVEVVAPFHELEGVQVGRVLVTHLHSYATPMIRYDLGDLAALRETCPCGHQGPTVHSLQGRVSSVLKHRDGRISPFHVRGPELAEVGSFTEYRMRQTEYEKIVLELGGRTSLDPQERSEFELFLRARAGPEFVIEVRPCETIDWGESTKRHGFRCEVA